MTNETKTAMIYRKILLPILISVLWVGCGAYLVNNDIIENGAIAFIIPVPIFIGYFFIFKSYSNKYFELISMSLMAAFFAFFLFYMLTFSLG